MCQFSTASTPTDKLMTSFNPVTCPGRRTQHGNLRVVDEPVTQYLVGMFAECRRWKRRRTLGAVELKRKRCCPNHALPRRMRVLHQVYE